MCSQMEQKPGSAGLDGQSTGIAFCVRRTHGRALGREVTQKICRLTFLKYEST